MPPSVSALRKLRIWVDSTFTEGIWLKFEYSWEAYDEVYRAVGVVHDLDDPLAQRLLQIRHVEEVAVRLQAPRRGHFVGAFLTMVAKMDDVYHLINAMSTDAASPGHVTITFATEAVQPGQSTKEAKNFWECRSPKILQDASRKHLAYSGQMPCYYEYMLISPLLLKRAPDVEFLTWPRIHAHRKSKEVGKLLEELLSYLKEEGLDIAQIVEDLSRIHKRRDELAAFSANIMADQRNREQLADSGSFGHTGEVLQWERINYDSASLRSRYQFLLDTLKGPVGGPLDMLRLYRFRTMDASTANFFGRAEGKARKHRGGLAGAASELSHRLRSLFNPLAPDHVRNLRTRCPHLRHMRWATDTSLSPRQSCPRDLWLRQYPEGIRCHSQRDGSLAEWRLQCATELYKPLHNDLVWLTRWWDCLSCCWEGFGAMDSLSRPQDQRVPENWAAVFRKAPHISDEHGHYSCSERCHLDRPVAIRLSLSRSGV
ncbi:hypothetical protein ACJ41O_008687 [Fusarium nematophilum]